MDPARFCFRKLPLRDNHLFWYINEKIKVIIFAVVLTCFWWQPRKKTAAEDMDKQRDMHTNRVWRIMRDYLCRSPSFCILWEYWSLLAPPPHLGEAYYNPDDPEWIPKFLNGIWKFSKSWGGKVALGFDVIVIILKILLWSWKSLSRIEKNPENSH